MVQTIYIIENEIDMNPALTQAKGKKNVKLVADKRLSISKHTDLLEIEIKENLLFKTYQYMRKLINEQPDLDYFLTMYKDFSPMIKTRHIIETAIDLYDVNHFVLPDKPYNRALADELHNVKIGFYPTQHDDKLSNLPMKKRIGEWLLKSQHKTMLYPNIVLRTEFFSLKKSYTITDKKEKNALLIVSSHINYPRVLLPFEEILKKNGYRIFYLAQTKRVANYVRQQSQQHVHTIQEFVGVRNLLGGKTKNLHLESDNQAIQAFINQNRSKIFEMDKYYSAFQKLIDRNSFELIMTADDVEPFGRGIVKFAKQKQIKTVTMQHGYIADQYNYSSTISDYMLTWDEISSEVINTYKTTETNVRAVGPPHLTEAKKVEKKTQEVILSWFPVPNEYMNKTSNVAKVFEGIKKAVQQIWIDQPVKLVVKLHPFDSVLKYQNSAEQVEWKQNIQVEIYQHEKNPMDVVLVSDVIIAINTSVVYEAYLLGVPVVAFNPLNEELNPLLQSYYQGISQDSAQLEQRLRTAIHTGHNGKQPSDLVDWSLVEMILFEQKENMQ